MNTNQNHKRKWSIIIVILLIAAAIGACFLAQKYNLFSKHIFNFNSADVERIHLQSGTTGKMIDYQDSSEIQEVTDYLNSFVYKNRAPGPPEGIDGWSYGITLYIDGEKYPYQFDANRILVDDTWYIGENDYFSQFTTALDSLPAE